MKHFYPLNKLNGARFAFLLLAFFWHFSALAAPRHVKHAPEPTWVKKLPHNIQTKIDPKNVNGGYYYLLLDKQYEVEQEEVFYHNIYKITSEEGVQNNSELSFYFDPNHEQLLMHKVIIWRNGKPLDKLNIDKVKVLQREEGMESKIYDESLTAVLVLEDVRVGDIVEYAATIKGANPVFGGKFFNVFNLQNYDPTDELFVHIVVPQQRKLNFKLYLSDQKPTIATANGKTSYTWHAKNVPATVVDGEVPEWYDPYPGVYVSEFSSWGQVAEWALPLYDIKAKPSKALSAKIDSIKAQYSTESDRIVAALRFVQDEVRYLGLEAGIGGFKPRDPSVVFAQRFGDCKDKALLLCTMLRQMGITAYPALVSSSSQKHVEDVLPSPHAFNHCIVQVVQKGKTLWYDATMSKQRGTYYNIYLPEYGKALVIAPHTKGLETVQSNAAKTARVKVQEIFNINSVGGAAELEVHTEYHGSQADYQRSYFASTSLKDIAKSYLNFYASSYPEIEAAAEIRYEDDEASNTFTTIEKYNVAELWVEQKENKEIVEASFYPQVLRGYVSLPKTTKRTMPLALSYPTAVEHKITVLLPEEWPVANENYNVEDDAFTFTKDVHYGPDGREVNLLYTYQTLQDHVPADAVASFVKKQNEILDEMSYGLTYNKALTGGGTATDFSSVSILFALLVLGAAAFGAYKLYYYDPAPAPSYSLADGEPIGGWLILVAIGLFLTPLRMLFVIFDEVYFQQTVWDGFWGNSAAVSGALAGVVVAELAFNIAFFVYSCILVYLFYRRRTSVPRLMVIFYASNFVFIVAEYPLMYLLDLPLDGGGDDTTTETFRAFIAAAVWIPYFYLSHRVKGTFVEQLHPAPIIEPIITDEAEQAGVLN
ncbi:DUF3857 domain-containing protein [Pontibacter harenae]|uniref:DUF3857 domain-containing protein n=1 Tax=Pontibacter harenae TaxID=2894083 RepID=UPI001E4B7789|nr:DUF3857 domain-containing protein [Pontibacter harenae]MCC9165350.1 DUF3857 domain-containing protein [Pontibacter harenae]